MLSSCTLAPTLVAVVVIVVVVVCLEANLAHTAEQGVDSHEPLDYLNKTLSLLSIDKQSNDGK